MQTHESEVVEGETKIIFYCLGEIQWLPITLPPSPPRKGRKKERAIYFNTPKKYLLVLETQR